MKKGWLVTVILLALLAVGTYVFFVRNPENVQAQDPVMTTDDVTPPIADLPPERP